MAPTPIEPGRDLASEERIPWWVIALCASCWVVAIMVALLRGAH